MGGGGEWTREERSGPQRRFIERWRACRSGVGAQHQSPLGHFYICMYILVENDNGKK